LEEKLIALIIQGNRGDWALKMGKQCKTLCPTDYISTLTLLGLSNKLKLI
jgi:hypothetical protein